jgi:hypothetical protein
MDNRRKRSVGIVAGLAALAIVLLAISSCREIGAEKSVYQEFIDYCSRPPEEYSWEIQDRTEDSGSRGTKCSAVLVLENKSDQAQKWLIRKAINDGNDDHEGWYAEVLEPSQKTTILISNTKYENGDETYQWVHELIVLSNKKICEPDADLPLDLFKYTGTLLENPCP